jgi:ribosome maturation factor RimP
MATEILATIKSLVLPVLTGFGIELVDLEFRREGRDWLLRLFIDKPGGVTLDDCADVSRELSAILEVEDPIESSYRLEVSSPGLDRPLKTPEDFVRFAGQMVRIKTRSLLDPDQRGHCRKTFVGELLGLDDTQLKLRLVDKRGGIATLHLDDIEKANLEPSF